MPDFSGEEWLRAWVDLANADAAFRASDEGWVGSVGLIVLDRPRRHGAGRSDTVFRLRGADGLWTSAEIVPDPSDVDDATFVIAAEHDRWKEIIRGELNPIKGIVSGRIRVHGHLPDVLKRIKSILIMAELASRLETRFVDEPEPS